MTGTPQVIPAVRDFRRADGRGWRPSKGARVVVPAGEKSNVADEAQRMANDLAASASSTATRPYGPATSR